MALAFACGLMIKPDVSISPVAALAMLTILTTLQGGRASWVCEG